MEISLLFFLFLIIILLPKQKKQNDLNKKQMMLTLLRQMARWSVASIQDENPFVAVLHANYAAGYLWAIKDIFTENEIKIVSGLDLHTIEESIVNNQDLVSRKFVGVCPQFIPEKNLLTLLAGQSN